MVGKTSGMTAASQVAAEAAKPHKAASKSQSGKAAKPVLLSGGNPQIAKGHGDAPVTSTSTRTTSSTKLSSLLG